MNKTSIEWVKNPDGTQGYTWNPITGCLNGCEYCFARKLANGRLKQRYLANHLWTTCEVPHSIPALLDPFYPRFYPERLNDLVIHPKTRKGIFVCDMGELFGDWVPGAWQNEIFSVIKAHPQHRFYLLSKQPQNLNKFSPFPDNCYVGCTATTNNQLQYGLAHIAEVKARIKFISFEPLLERVSFLAAEMVDWLIVGAMTCSGGDLAKLSSLYPQLTPMPWEGRYTLQPKIEWVEEIIKAALMAGIPAFLKENLLPLFEKEGITKREDWTGLRQELPK